MVKVIFVCMGNICRSPTAEGVFRHLLEKEGMTEHVLVDSAGTHAYHCGEPPDRRALAAARRRGIDLSEIRARKVQPDDLERFDYVLAMDRDNLACLEALADTQRQDHIRLFLDFAPHRPESEVPDPYYGGPHGFELVLDLIEEASQGLLGDIRHNHGPLLKR